MITDWLDSYESVADQVKRFRIRLKASRWVTARRRSPVGASQLRLDRRTCLVKGTVRSDRRRIDALLAVIARNPSGKIIGADFWMAGPLPRGRSGQILARIDPGPCLRRRLRFDAYPTCALGSS